MEKQAFCRFDLYTHNFLFGRMPDLLFESPVKQRSGKANLKLNIADRPALTGTSVSVSVGVAEPLPNLVPIGMLVSSIFSQASLGIKFREFFGRPVL